MEALTTDNKNLEMLKSLSEGDNEKAQKFLSERLRAFISIRVYASKSAPVNFYEGFMTGILSSFGDRLSDLKVEHEAGLGFADIRFCDESTSSAMVIELKVAQNVKQARSSAQSAIEQIEGKGYASEYIDEKEIPNVVAIGIAFYGKNCVVASKRLN